MCFVSMILPHDLAASSRPASASSRPQSATSRASSVTPRSEFTVQSVKPSTSALASARTIEVEADKGLDLEYVTVKRQVVDSMTSVLSHIYLQEDFESDEEPGHSAVGK